MRLENVLCKAIRINKYVYFLWLGDLFQKTSFIPESAVQKLQSRICFATGRSSIQLYQLIFHPHHQMGQTLLFAVSSLRIRCRHRQTGIFKHQKRRAAGTDPRRRRSFRRGIQRRSADFIGHNAKRARSICRRRIVERQFRPYVHGSVNIFNLEASRISGR